eukprot:m.48169 g.48169  ORF g.48169 m.48169 type:complete len:330 (+) comp12704_c0_seq4:22-1011(+)
MGSRVSCAEMTDIGCCLGGADGFKQARGLCAWTFANHSTPGRCFDFESCDVAGPDFDEWNEIQTVPIPPLNVTEPWIIHPTHHCLAMSHFTLGVGYAVFLLVFFLVFCRHLVEMVSGSHLTSIKWAQFICFLGAFILVVFAAHTSWTEGTPNAALLPFFALLTLFHEVIHVVHEVNPNSFTLIATFHLLLSLPFSGVLLQFLGAYEIVPVTFIAWIDVMVTLFVAPIYFFNKDGKKSHGLPSVVKGWIASVWFIILLSFAIKMQTSCKQSDYNNQSTTFEEFEHCSQKFFNRAYTLCFISILRPLLVTTAENLTHVVDKQERLIDSSYI